MRSFAVLLAVMTLLSLSAAKDAFQASDFAKQQLHSIGNEQARGAVKNQLVQGTLAFHWLNAVSGAEGQLQFVSEGDKFVSVLKLPSVDYHGEQFVSDGKKSVVKQIRPGVYSALGRFVFEHPEVLTEGLWGGTLSTAWALAHLDERHAKLEDRGLKKIDGRDLHRVDYFPKKSSDLQIELYFEPETSRHVMTVYSYHVMARGGGARPHRLANRKGTTGWKSALPISKRSMTSLCRRDGRYSTAGTLRRERSGQGPPGSASLR